MISISTLQCDIEGCNSLGSKSGKNGTHVVLLPGPTLIWSDIWSLILHWHVVTDNWQPIFNLIFFKQKQTKKTEQRRKLKKIKKLILLIKKKKLKQRVKSFISRRHFSPASLYKMGLLELCLAPQTTISQQIHILIILNYEFCLRNRFCLSIYHKGTA